MYRTLGKVCLDYCIGIFRAIRGSSSLARTPPPQFVKKYGRIRSFASPSKSRRQLDGEREILVTGTRSLSNQQACSCVGLPKKERPPLSGAKTSPPPHCLVSTRTCTCRFRRPFWSTCGFSLLTTSSERFSAATRLPHTLRDLSRTCRPPPVRPCICSRPCIARASRNRSEARQASSGARSAIRRPARRR